MSNSSFTSRHPYYCFNVPVAVWTLNAFYIAKVLLLTPLVTFVVWLGLSRWRRRRPDQAASDSDVFVFHQAAIELAAQVSQVFYFYGQARNLQVVFMFGFLVSNVAFPGELGLHILTCVERYLAVVHPVTYRGLRQSGGARIRNISVVGAWLLSFVWVGITVAYIPNFPSHIFFSFMLFCLAIVSFCSVSVLWVLTRRGPGGREVDGGEDGARVDQTKLRAFHTVTTILAMLWLWFFGILVCTGLHASLLLDGDGTCLVATVGIWFNLPSSLVLPLLFLHRQGKLHC